MRQCRRAGFKVFMLAFFILALVVSAMAAEVPDPTACDKDGATDFTHHVSKPERYGVINLDRKGDPLSIEEKPLSPKSNLAVTGLYFYDNKVVDLAKNLKPSKRGELEITSINQAYLDQGLLNVEHFGRGFAWLDMGTHESLLEAAQFVETLEKRQGYKVACLEEIAFNNGWLSVKRLTELAQPMRKNSYGQYLLSLTVGEQ